MDLSVGIELAHHIQMYGQWIKDDPIDSFFIGLFVTILLIANDYAVSRWPEATRAIQKTYSKVKPSIAKNLKDSDTDN